MRQKKTLMHREKENNDGFGNSNQWKTSKTYSKAKMALRCDPLPGEN